MTSDYTINFWFSGNGQVSTVFVTRFLAK